MRLSSGVFVLVGDERLFVAAVFLVNVLAREKRLLVLGASVNGLQCPKHLMPEARASIATRSCGSSGRSALAASVKQRPSCGISRGCSFIEVDEQHSFVQVKQGHLRPDHSAEAGDTWTWAAIHRRSRLVLAFYVGKRTEQAANAFIGDLRARLVTMPQITSDGLAMYAPAIARAFGPGVDFAMTVKAWDTSKRRRGDADPADGALLKVAVLGDPGSEHGDDRTRRAPQPHDPPHQRAHAPEVPRVLEDARQPRRSRCARVRPLQLLPRREDAEDDSSGGALA